MSESKHRMKLLAQALGDVLVRAGVLRDDVPCTGPELLLAAKTYCESKEGLEDFKPTAERKIPALVFEPGDTAPKFMQDVDLVLALVGEGQGALLFKGIPLAEIAEVFAGLGRLLHQAAVNEPARVEILRSFHLVQRLSRGEQLTQDEQAELARAPSRLAALTPCTTLGCRFCTVGSNTGGN